MANLIDSSLTVFKQIFGCKKIFSDDSDEEEAQNNDPMQFIKDIND
jgi:hypothetical protein